MSEMSANSRGGSGIFGRGGAYPLPHVTLNPNKPNRMTEKKLFVCTEGAQKMKMSVLASGTKIQGFIVI